MADENINPPAPEHKDNNPAQERITQLSDKVKQEAEARAKAEADRTAAERRATFAEGFADVLSNHPAAKDHKDDIRAKVDAGYSVEDATFAVLGKAGKLGGSQAPIVPAPTQVAGGSAVTTPTQGGAKALNEMSTAEKRAELEKLLILT